MKLINDPVYGLIHIRTPLIFDVIEHPVFQRLRRIKQTGLTHLVYPGAVHTRFHHALGAMHLMGVAVDELRARQIAITKQEEEAVLLAVLLHDIGHGPYSHALETLIISAHHEKIGIQLMHYLAEIFGEPVRLALEMFQGHYHRPFFHQLISGQLDLDRLDYLSRDSFYTGVAEGVVGHDRILRMLSVVDDKLVVEEKALYSIEKFLVARRIMYWQVYLHKTSLAAEGMAKRLISLVRQQLKEDSMKFLSPELAFFLSTNIEAEELRDATKTPYAYFLQLDDTSVDVSIKNLQQHPDYAISFLARGLTQRHLHKVYWLNNLPSGETADSLKQKCIAQYGQSPEVMEKLIWTGNESNLEYLQGDDEIMILAKNGNIRPFSSYLENPVRVARNFKGYIACPKIA